VHRSRPVSTGIGRCPATQVRPPRARVASRALRGAQPTRRARPVASCRYGFLPPSSTLPPAFAECLPTGAQIAGSVFFYVPYGVIL
jgi:hypothetical protein